MKTLLLIKKKKENIILNEKGVSKQPKSDRSHNKQLTKKKQKTLPLYNLAKTPLRRASESI